MPKNLLKFGGSPKYPPPFYFGVPPSLKSTPPRQFQPQKRKLTHPPQFNNEKSAQRGSFRAGYPADIRGSFARISRPKTSVRALEILEKNKHLGADIHDPKARTSTTRRVLQKLRSEKLWAEFSFPNNEVGEGRFLCRIYTEIADWRSPILSWRLPVGGICFPQCLHPRVCKPWFPNRGSRLSAEQRSGIKKRGF